MTLAEAGKKFEIPIETLEKYVSFGFIKKREREVYQEEDFAYLGLIDTLWHAGFSSEEIRKYFLLMEREGTDDEQIYLLRKHRRMLLDTIHEKQQHLDYLDFMIREKKKNLKTE